MRLDLEVFCHHCKRESQLKSDIWRWELHIFAFSIQSRFSWPSSEPHGPPCTFLNSRGCHSEVRCDASSRCMSSILDFSSVAVSWSLCFSATTTLCQSFCDSRSPCSANGRAEMLVSRVEEASKMSSCFPVYRYQQDILPGTTSQTAKSFKYIFPFQTPESS